MTWFDHVVKSPSAAGLELAARFAEERHKVLAENAANIDTPDFAARRLDPRAFQKTLDAALQHAATRAEPFNGALELSGNPQFNADASGRVTVRPASEPAENLLFHDGTNARLESLMSDAAENNLYYQVATSLLRAHYDSTLTAIRGRL